MSDKATCVWWNEDGVWYTDCGELFEFTVDGPKENSFKYCYRCGKMIDVKRMDEKED